MKTKICTKCKIEKTLKSFYKRNTKCGVCSECKKCTKLIHKIYRDSNKIKIKKYRRKNKLKLQKYLLKYKKENKNILIPKQRKASKRWRINHKKYIANQKRKRYHNDFNFKLRMNIARRLSLALKQNWKSGHTLELLGCSIKFLKKYLEKKFQKGMSWKNYGRIKNTKCWEIDHIKPCASFDLSKDSEQRKCFRYTNLQPLWALDNLLKKDKYNV